MFITENYELSVRLPFLHRFHLPLWFVGVALAITIAIAVVVAMAAVSSKRREQSD